MYLSWNKLCLMKRFKTNSWTNKEEILNFKSVMPLCMEMSEIKKWRQTYTRQIQLRKSDERRFWTEGLQDIQNRLSRKHFLSKAELKWPLRAAKHAILYTV